MRAGCTQSSPTSSPDIRITIGSDVYTSQDNGRLTRAYLDEQVWGGQYVVEIDNADETLSSKDYVGSAATIHLSFIGGTGSDMSPLWVHNQQLISREGKLLLQLNCIDAWGLLSQVNADLAMAAYNQYWQESSELADKTLPSGADIPAALQAAITANYDRTIFSILGDLVDTIGETISLDDDDGIINARKPPITMSNPVSGVRRLLDMTKSYALWKSNGTFGIIKPDAHATIYTFNAANLTFNNLEDVAVVIPNRVTFYSLDSDGDAWINGTPAVDSDSYTALGIYIDRHYLLANLNIDGRSDTASLTALATGALAKIQGERSQGVMVAPMHCSLELFDKIQIDDYMYGTPRTTTGYVHRLVREYDRGVYRITIQLGGVTGGYTPPGGNIPMPLDSEPPGFAGVPAADWGLPPWEDILPKAVQGYMHDIVFFSTDWNTVAWTSGTITFYDETTQSINSGNTGNLADDDIYYIYFDLEDASPNVLKVTTDGDYNANHISDHTGVLCVCQRASASGYGRAVFLPGWEKQPLITPDMIYMPSIQEWDDGSGNHYYKIGDTQIFGNQIKISADTYYMPGYNATEKTKTFHTTPTTPYHLGDIWVDDKVYKYCTTARETGAYQAGDWSTSTKKRVGTTYISNGKIYLSSVIEDSTHRTVTDSEMTTWNTVEDKPTVYRQASEPSGGNEGDIWIETDEGDRPWTHNGSIWVRSYTEIEGGRITTGTINCQVVTIQTASSGQRVILNTSGITIIGAKLILKDSAGAHTGELYVDTSGNLRLDDSAWSGVVKVRRLESTLYIKATSYLQSLDSFYLGEHTSVPAAVDGKIVFNPNTGYINVYSSAYGNWWHVNRDSGWA